MRLLPLQVGVTNSVVMKLTQEELAKRLEERGLPPIVFGNKVPQSEDDDDREILDAEVILDPKPE